MSEEQEIQVKSLDEVISTLRSFGIEDTEDIITMDAGGKTIQLRISNISTEDEMTALIAAEGKTGHLWIQAVKTEILSRSISWINGHSIRDLKGTQRIITDPTDDSKRDIQVVLRNLLLGFGQEVLQTLWKVACVHSQRIEDRLVKSFPDSAIFTEVEKRIMDRAIREIADQDLTLIKEGTVDLVNEAEVETQE